MSGGWVGGGVDCVPGSQTKTQRRGFHRSQPLIHSLVLPAPQLASPRECKAFSEFFANICQICIFCIGGSLGGFHWVGGPLFKMYSLVHLVAEKLTSSSFTELCTMCFTFQTKTKKGGDKSHRSPMCAYSLGRFTKWKFWNFEKCINFLCGIPHVSIVFLHAMKLGLPVKFCIQNTFEKVNSDF